MANNAYSAVFRPLPCTMAYEPFPEMGMHGDRVVEHTVVIVTVQEQRVASPRAKPTTSSPLHRVHLCYHGSSRIQTQRRSIKLITAAALDFYLARSPPPLPHRRLVAGVSSCTCTNSPCLPDAFSCLSFGLLRAASRRLRKEHRWRWRSVMMSVSALPAASGASGATVPLTVEISHCWPAGGVEIAHPRGCIVALVLVCKFENSEVGYKAPRRLERKRSAPMSSSTLSAASGVIGGCGAPSHRKPPRERKEGVARLRPGGAPGLRPSAPTRTD